MCGTADLMLGRGCALLSLDIFEEKDAVTVADTALLKVHAIYPY